MNTIYVICEASELDNGARNPCERMFNYVAAFSTEEKARDSLRKIMRTSVNEAYEDDDEPPSIDDVLDDILDSCDNGGYWMWNGPDRSVVWSITPVTVDSTAV